MRISQSYGYHFYKDLWKVHAAWQVNTACCVLNLQDMGDESAIPHWYKAMKKAIFNAFKTCIHYCHIER